MSLNSVYLSLGSNLGDKEGHLKEVVQAIGEIPGVKISGKSSLYQTDPVGYTDQDCFLNAVLRIETDLNPLDLLNKTQEIENRLGRKRIIHWGPRTIDIDILLFNQEIVSLPRLIIPHGEMHKRLFVLVPLNEIDENAVIPSLGLVKDVLDSSEYSDNIMLVKNADQW